MPTRVRREGGAPVIPGRRPHGYWDCARDQRRDQSPTFSAADSAASPAFAAVVRALPAAVFAALAVAAVPLRAVEVVRRVAARVPLVRSATTRSVFSTDASSVCSTASAVSPASRRPLVKALRAAAVVSAAP